MLFSDGIKNMFNIVHHSDGNTQILQENILLDYQGSLSNKIWRLCLVPT